MDGRYKMVSWKEVLMVLFGVFCILFCVSTLIVDSASKPILYTSAVICFMGWAIIASHLLEAYRTRIKILVTLLNGKYDEVPNIKNRGIELERHECPCCKNDFLDVYQQMYFDDTMRYFTRVSGVFYRNAPLFEMCRLYVCGCSRCGARTAIYLDKKRAIQDWNYGYLIRSKERNKK